jgi:hypothetical protein
VLLASCHGSSAETTTTQVGSSDASSTSPADANASSDDASEAGLPHDAGTLVDAAADADASPVPVGSSVLQYHSHPNRDGYFIDAKLTKAAAAGFRLDRSFRTSFTGNVYGAPLYVENGPSGNGTFYLATESDDVFAFDEKTGAVVWQRNVGTPADASGAGCGNIHPLGITGTPAIDLATRQIVFSAASSDGDGGIATHTIYALSIDDGTIRWSVDVSKLTAGNDAGFNPKPQNQRGAVLIAAGSAYVVYGGHAGDCGDYRGWVVGVPLDGAGAEAFATDVKGAGIWGPGGAASDGTSVFVTTGNGYAWTGPWSDSEGLLRLDPGPAFSGPPPDYFSPYDWAALDQADLDLGSSGPLVIDVPGFSPPALVMAQGKDGYLYLVDRKNLGGVAPMTPGANVGTLQLFDGSICNGAAWATLAGTTYVVVHSTGYLGIACPGSTEGDLIAVKLDPTVPAKMSVAWCVDGGGHGSAIITSSDGVHDGLVWAAGASGTGQLHAWDLATGAVVLDGTDAGIPVPDADVVRPLTTILAANGRIVVDADDAIYAFGSGQ